MKYFRFSLSTLQWFVVVVALSIALVQARLQITKLEAEINSALPMREIDIAAQIEKATASMGVPVIVESLAYSPRGTYLIGYAYFDPEIGTRQTSTFLLTYEKDGRYVGFLRTGPFLKKQSDETGERGTKVVVLDDGMVAELRESE